MTGMGQIVVVGAGFAGMWSALSAARLLELNDDRATEVVVLAPVAELRVRPRLYEPEPQRLAAPLGELFDAVGIRFVQGAATRIDVAAHQVNYQSAESADVLEYDKLVLATGSNLVRPPLAGVEHAFDVDQIEDAIKLDTHLKNLASTPPSKARNTVVVCGGGFTGIEVATEMPNRLRKALGDDADVKVIIIDRGQEVGAVLGEGPRAQIIEASNQAGIEWILDSAVASVDQQGVALADGRRIDSLTPIWTVGMRANALTEQIPAQRDPAGRLHVDKNLKVIDVEDVFAAGDVAYALTDVEGHFALMSCQHANALGRFAGNNAAASLLGVDPEPYRQLKYVTCLDLGSWGAVFCEGWDREVKKTHEAGKETKIDINTVKIYPPPPDRATALAEAAPISDASRYTYN